MTQPPETTDKPIDIFDIIGMILALLCAGLFIYWVFDIII